MASMVTKPCGCQFLDGYQMWVCETHRAPVEAVTDSPATVDDDGPTDDTIVPS